MGEDHSICVTVIKTRGAKKANSNLPAEASKAANLPQNDRADPGGCSSTQSLITHPGPLQEQRGLLALRNKDNSAKGHVGWRCCPQKSCKPEPSPAPGALTERGNDPLPSNSKSRAFRAPLGTSDLLEPRESLSWWLSHCPLFTLHSTCSLSIILNL